MLVDIRLCKQILDGMTIYSLRDTYSDKDGKLLWVASHLFTPVGALEGIRKRLMEMLASLENEPIELDKLPKKIFVGEKGNEQHRRTRTIKKPSILGA